MIFNKLAGLSLEDENLQKKTVFEDNKVKTLKEEYLHSFDDKPSVIEDCGTVIWHKDGYRGREGDKPTMITSSGVVTWYKNGVPHRKGGKPAKIYPDGSAEWWENGQMIKKTGPEGSPGGLRRRFKDSESPTIGSGKIASFDLKEGCILWKKEGEEPIIETLVSPWDAVDPEEQERHFPSGKTSSET